MTYTPPFDYFVRKNEADHTIYAADFVTDDSGTGIVHTAPEFGESDFDF